MRSSRRRQPQGPDILDDLIPAACLEPQAVFIDDGFVVSDEGFGPTRLAVDLTGREIAAGRNQITLHSFDFHGPTDSPQTNEQWRIELSSGGGPSIYRFDASADLPDDDQANATTVGPESVLAAADTLTAIHAFENLPDDGTVNSIYPVCAVFDLLEDPPVLLVTKQVDADGDGTFAATENRDEGEGGPASFLLAVENPSTTDVMMAALIDDVFGDLDGVGTCITPQVIGAGTSYSCSFSGDVPGQNAGGSHRNTVTASPTIGEPVSASAEVNFVDVTPSLEVTKSAVNSVTAPGAPVEFTVTIENTSSAADPVTVQSLVDDVFGSLVEPFGEPILTSSCGVVQIEPGATHECTFNALVSGEEGETHTDAVTAIATDDENNEATGSAEHTITFTEPGTGPQMPTVFLTDTEIDDVPKIDGTSSYAVLFFNLVDARSSPATFTVWLPNGVTLNDDQVPAALPVTVAAGSCAVAGDPGTSEVKVAVGSLVGGDSVSCPFAVKANVDVGQVVVATVCLESDVCDDEPTRLDGPPLPFVLGSSQTAPPAADPEVLPELAFTGTDPGHLLAVALLLVVAGGLMTHYASARPTGNSATPADQRTRDG